jgi:hypothetical protein
MLNFISFWHNWKNLGFDQDGRQHFQAKINPNKDIDNSGQIILSNFVHPLTGKKLKPSLLRVIHEVQSKDVAYWKYHEGDCFMCFIL